VLPREEPMAAPSRQKVALKQKHCLEKITDLIEWELEPYHEKTWDELNAEEQLDLVETNERLTKSMNKAIGLGLQDHPLVRSWLAVRSGNRGELRRSRVGLERGVKSPSRLAARDKSTPWLLGLLSESERLLALPLGQRAAYRVLRGKGLLTKEGAPKPITWQAYRKLIWRRGLLALPSSQPRKTRLGGGSLRSQMETLLSIRWGKRPRSSKAAVK
jgi:hypothetical protein